MLINQMLDGLNGRHKPQLKFLSVLFTTIFVCGARLNFSSLARPSEWNEKTYRRHLRQVFEFSLLNEAISKQANDRIEAFARDASFIKKSGQKTFSQTASLVLTVDQTEPNLDGKAGTDQDAEQFEKVADKILKYTKIGVFDGFYAKKKFVARTVATGLTMISRLRQDANLRHLSQGPQKLEGRRRKFAETVACNDLRKFAEATIVLDHQEIKLYAATVWSPGLKRNSKLAVVKCKTKSVNLCSPDLAMTAQELFSYYRSRFSIAFLLRDAKQAGGWSDCQVRDNQALEFHWNAAFTSVNLARGRTNENRVAGDKQPFSMKSLKQQFYKEHLLKLFIGKSGLAQSLIKYEETLASLRNYAVVFP